MKIHEKKIIICSFAFKWITMIVLTKGADALVVSYSEILLAKV